MTSIRSSNVWIRRVVSEPQIDWVLEQDGMGGATEAEVGRRGLGFPPSPVGRNGCECSRSEDMLASGKRKVNYREVQLDAPDFRRNYRELLCGDMLHLG